MHKLTMLSGPVALLAAAAIATAGPAWVEGGDEGGDAGSLPPDAQNTKGSGTLMTISGVLEGTEATVSQGDFEDMYVIQIADPTMFFATTAFFPGSTDFDSHLYLFRIEMDPGIAGFGLLGNEDTGGPPPGAAALGDPVTEACCFPEGYCSDLTPEDCEAEGGIPQGPKTNCKYTECEGWVGACCVDDECLDETSYALCVKYGGIFLGDGTNCEDDLCPNPEGSTMGNAATDDSGAMVNEAGLYLLAITVAPREPFSAGGLIFEFVDPMEVSGPDGPGGDPPLPIIDWGELGQGYASPVRAAAGIGDVPGAYTIYLGGVEFSEPEEIEAPLDIKPGGCPNSFNNKGTGTGSLPVALVGTGDFDVSMVDTSTLLLSRGDGDGGSVTPIPRHTKIRDVATPYDGEPCGCHELEGDGILDIKLKFHRTTMTQVMGLGDLPGGSLVELVLTGDLTDGTAFVARDCIRLVPPH